MREGYCNITARIDKDFKKEVDEFCAAQDVNISQVVRGGLKLYISSEHWLPLGEELYYLLEDYCEMNKVTMKEVVTKAILRYID